MAFPTSGIVAHQMAALSEQFQVVAIDQRGYNLSDKPKGVENYDMRQLVGDVAAVIKHWADRATIVGHDWGGMVAWQFAMNVPQKTEAAHHSQLAASQRPAARAAVEPRADQEQRVRGEFQTSRRPIRRYSSASR